VLQKFVTLFVNSSRTVREQLEQMFPNTSRDEHDSFFTNSRRTNSKSRSWRNVQFVNHEHVREPYLLEHKLVKGKNKRKMSILDRPKHWGWQLN